MEHRRYRSISTALMVSTLLLLAGCALPSLPGQARGPQPLLDAQQIFRPLMAGPRNGDLDSLDPALIQFGTDYQVAQLIFPPLLTIDDHNQVAPWAAERWEPGADGLTWTFHLRLGMTWSDGVPIDASTYAYSLNRSLDPCTASGVSQYLSGTNAELIAGSIAFTQRYGAYGCPPGQAVSPETLIGKSILASDPQTLVLRLSHPAAYFPASLTYPTAWAQPRQLIERYGMRWTDYLAGFGGNLFTVKLWDHAGHFDLIRNDSFWDKKPKLKEVDFTLYKDLDTEWADYKSGKGDYFSTPPAAEISIAKAMPGFHEDPDLTMLYLTPNWALAPFDDVRVRQAFDLALDRTANAHVLSHDTVIPTIHMVPEGMPGYNPSLHDPEGRVGEAALQPDAARARALWQAYVRDKWGGDVSKAPKVVFVIPEGAPAEKAATYVAQWQAAMPGLRITLFEYGPTTDLYQRKYLQLEAAGWVVDYPDPQDVLSLLTHTNSAYSNQKGISLPAADALMDQADVNPDPVARLTQYQQAEQLLVNAVAWIPTGQVVNVYLVRPRVGGGYHERASESAALAVWQRIFLIKA